VGAQARAQQLFGDGGGPGSPRPRADTPGGGRSVGGPSQGTGRQVAEGEGGDWEEAAEWERLRRLHLGREAHSPQRGGVTASPNGWRRGGEAHPNARHAGTGMGPPATHVCGVAKGAEGAPSRPGAVGQGGRAPGAGLMGGNTPHRTWVWGDGGQCEGHSSARACAVVCQEVTTSAQSPTQGDWWGEQGGPGPQGGSFHGVYEQVLRGGGTGGAGELGPGDPRAHRTGGAACRGITGGAERWGGTGAAWGGDRGQPEEAGRDRDSGGAVSARAPRCAHARGAGTPAVHRGGGQRAGPAPAPHATGLPSSRGSSPQDTRSAPSSISWDPPWKGRPSITTSTRRGISWGAREDSGGGARAGPGGPRPLCQHPVRRWVEMLQESVPGHHRG